MAAGDDDATDVSAPGTDSGAAQNYRQDRRCGAAFEGIFYPRQVATGNVTGFVGDNADDLLGALGLRQHASIDKQPLSAGDQDIKGFVPDQMNLNRRRIKVGDEEYWR